MADDNQPPPPPRRRSSRLALLEVSINESSSSDTSSSQNASPDELVIIQRGPRCKPITWSPVDHDSITPVKLAAEEEEEMPRALELNPKLRRRLILSPGKSSPDLGEIIAKKLKTLPKFV